MAEASESAGDKTEAATQRQMDQARSAGRAPVSREAAVFVSLAAAVAVLGYQSKSVFQAQMSNLSLFLLHSNQAEMSAISFDIAARIALATVFPILIVPVVGASLAVLLQTGLLVHPGVLRPDFARISPFSGFKRIFGWSGVAELLKSLAKFCCFGMAIWISIKGDLTGLLRLQGKQPAGLPFEIMRPIAHVALASVMCQAVVALIDILWVRFRFARDLRMTRQDIRDEMKETDGNPHTKARMRRIRLVRARKRMMERVPTAAVVVTNPTHYAVALAYDRAANQAPRIVAKGVDDVAARIRKVAFDANVPIVANPPLARALFQMELDTEIPPEHYKAVAEIIAYVWRLRRPGQIEAGADRQAIG
jgi:flagellar biosynthetic protein FlhB